MVAESAATKADSKKAADEKALNDWLPVTSSRDAKWWYSAFHNVTAMVGAGVLGLPYAMSELGWYVIYLPFILSYVPIKLSIIFCSFI